MGKRKRTCCSARQLQTFPASLGTRVGLSGRERLTYKQVLTSLRQSMDETRAMKAVYVYSNYNLREHRQSAPW